ncbi:rcc01693 family protein [Pseudooceanicola aestuarii]|uniref:rcc01693 family protein n=1 Tax=Pseudooceanicola aestuarii TaxID=2697319 RepID=UPI0013D18CEB|nr:rcc01693 family protein [Pseudooceanicola aestuarii]
MTGFDWPGLMRAGMQTLGLNPARFWALTPAELRLLLGAGAPSAAMGRDRLEEMLARFPDAATAGAARDAGNTKGSEDG